MGGQGTQERIDSPFQGGVKFSQIPKTAQAAPVKKPANAWGKTDGRSYADVVKGVKKPAAADAAKEKAAAEKKKQDEAAAAKKRQEEANRKRIIAQKEAEKKKADQERAAREKAA